MGLCLIFGKKIVIVMIIRDFLVVQWLTICLSVQGTWGQSLTGTQSPNAEVTKPECCDTEPVCHNSDPTHPNKINK